MGKLQSLRRQLSRGLPTLVTVFWLSQPILDVLGYWQKELEIPNALTMAARFVLLAGTLLVGFLLTEHRGWYYLAAALLAALTAGHVAACLPGGYHDAVSDLTNLLRIYYLPLMTLCMITFLREDRRILQVSLRCCAVNLAIIAGVMLVSTITGTDPHTYWMEKIGVLGWFVWANSQSAVLSMLAPLVILWTVRQWPEKLIPVALATLLAELTLYFFGTRLAFACMAAAGLCMAAACLLLRRNLRRQGLILLILTLLLTAAYPLSPVRSRQTKASATSQKNAEHLEQTGLEGETINAERLGSDPELRANVETYYNHYIRGTVQRFGLDRVTKQYAYTLDPQILGNRRVERLTFCTMLMEDAGPMSHLFGLNVMDMRELLPERFLNHETGQRVSGYMIYDVENDFHGVYFLTGWVGLILMIAFILCIVLRALWRVVRGWKRYATPEMAAFAVSSGFGILYGILTVSTLRRNNASVYFALALAGLWELSRRDALSEDPAPARPLSPEGQD